MQTESVLEKSRFEHRAERVLLFGIERSLVRKHDVAGVLRNEYQMRHTIEGPADATNDASVRTSNSAVPPLPEVLVEIGLLQACTRVRCYPQVNWIGGHRVVTAAKA